MNNGLTLIIERDGAKFYTTPVEFDQTHVVRCIKCNTIIMPQSINTQCNCGRVYRQEYGIIVVDIDKCKLIDI